MVFAGGVAQKCNKSPAGVFNWRDARRVPSSPLRRGLSSGLSLLAQLFIKPYKELGIVRWRMDNLLLGAGHL
ncbi:hypothetical protein IHE33_08060 [Mycetohabitans endofungorum]|uniref:hypothetical protein n=1 Tax=Mycetohabitans endofungorum TaxID=417203 RepID=UPI002B0623B4|nr:hypothetical protein [Mycetohabitans endofungorum]